MHKTKTLYLVRHAKSSWSDTELSDLQRPLNKRGNRDAPDMARRLANHVQQTDDQFPSPDLILCSPSIRTHTTACIFGRELHLTASSIQIDNRLYGRGIPPILALLRAQKDDCSALMLVGHNPELTQLHNQLNGMQVDNMPTCAIATLHFQLERWQHLTLGTGSLVDFDFPKKIVAI
ncbi:SixA phosphatase family protein [Teredinibacter purpureus]|uniref:SixA phosphatase family protein n=1 Tax=Teredinibacter purpureus TaxID=2731756 RepID=UPI0005F7826C|nr:histidine phosphatase family protein [Teredinibacter purpureus]